MRINRGAIKNNAKILMRETKPSVYLVTLIVLVISYALALIMTKVLGVDQLYFDLLRGSLSSVVVGDAGFGISGWAWLFYVAVLIMVQMLEVGFAIFILNAARLRATSFGNLLDGFAIFGRAIVLSILMGIFIYLWSLLLIIPGIVAAYRYSQAMYLLIENPDMSPMECIRASKRLMNGRKGELFVLDLSFIGWSLLAAIPFVAIWVTPYMELTYANYFIAITDASDSGYSRPVISEEGSSKSDSWGDGKPPWEK